MRRDLLITALLFALIGFVGGVAYKDHTGGLQPASSPPAPAAGAPESGLPAGHPPLELARRWSELQQQAQANPDDPAPAIELGNLLYDAGRWDAAAVRYRQALALDPANTDVRTDLGTCYYNLGRFEQAIAEFEKALEIEPTKPQALHNLTLARLRANDPAGARQAFSRLRRTNPEFEGIPRLAELLEREAPAP